MTLGPDRKTRTRWLKTPQGRPVVIQPSGRSNADVGDGDKGGGDGDEGDGKGGDGGKGGAKPDPNVFVADDGTRYVRQSHVDELIGGARTEGKTKGKEERDAELEQQKLLDQKKFEPLYVSEKKRADDAVQALADYKAEQTVTELRLKVGKAAGLSDTLSRRLVGTTEAELAADAASVAEELGITKDGDGDDGKGGKPKPRKAPSVEGGKGAGNGGNGEGKGEDGKPAKPVKPYGFQQPGDVPWG